MDRVQKILDDVTRKLVVGVVLGGSRAKGTHRPDSDIDIGIYYDESKGFEVRSVGEIATELDDEHRTDLITSLGAWGPWVNGGGWLVIGGYHVDFLFRDVRRVAQVIEEDTYLFGRQVQGEVPRVHFAAQHRIRYRIDMFGNCRKALRRSARLGPGAGNAN